MKKRSAVVLIVVVASGLLAWVIHEWWDPRLGRDFTGLPLSNVPYLRNVSEPITVLQGYSWDDGGSLGILFEDSKHVKMAACVQTDWLADGCVSFGEVTPQEQTQVPLQGIEEQTLIGLLQRWLAQDPQARAWYVRGRGFTRAYDGRKLFDESKPGQQRSKLYAMEMMKRLLERNR